VRLNAAKSDIGAIVDRPTSLHLNSALHHSGEDPVAAGALLGCCWCWPLLLRTSTSCSAVSIPHKITHAKQNIYTRHVSYTQIGYDAEAAFTPGNMYMHYVACISATCMPLPATNWQQFCCRQHVACCRQHVAWCKRGLTLLFDFCFMTLILAYR